MWKDLNKRMKIYVAGTYYPNNKYQFSSDKINDNNKVISKEQKSLRYKMMKGLILLKDTAILKLYVPNNISSKTYTAEFYKITGRKRQIHHIAGDFYSILLIIERTNIQ